MQQRVPPDLTPVAAAATRGKHAAIAVHVPEQERDKRMILTTNDFTYFDPSRNKGSPKVKVEKEKFHSLEGRQRGVMAGLSWTLRWTLVLCCLCLCFVSGEADARLSSSMRLSSVRMKAWWQEEQRVKSFGTVRSSSFSEETEKINFHLVMNGSPGDNLARCELDEEETCSESCSSANHDDADARGSIHAMSAGSEEGEGEEVRSQKLACLEEKEILIAAPPVATQIVVKANQSIKTLEAAGMDVETMSLYHVFLDDARLTSPAPGMSPSHQEMEDTSLHAAASICPKLKNDIGASDTQHLKLLTNATIEEDEEVRFFFNSFLTELFILFLLYLYH